MTSSPDIVCLGEPMIEFNRPKEGDGRTWLQGFGGDSQNVAIAAARQGASTGYLTSVGQDWMGDAFLDLWKDEGVDASRVTRHPTAPTGVSDAARSATSITTRWPGSTPAGSTSRRCCRPACAGAMRMRSRHSSASGPS